MDSAMQELDKIIVNGGPEPDDYVILNGSSRIHVGKF